MYILRIQIRAVLDAVIALLYTVVTGRKPDDRGNDAKRWWAKSLNPSGYLAQNPGVYNLDPNQPLHLQDEAVVNVMRYDACLAMLQGKGLMKRPEYLKLFKSGTLKFLSQSTIDLREQANVDAHEIKAGGMPAFKKVLLEASSIRDDLCSEKDFPCIINLIEFVEAVSKQN